jgi:hypothetical protein
MDYLCYSCKNMEYSKCITCGHIEGKCRKGYFIFAGKHQRECDVYQRVPSLHSYDPEYIKLVNKDRIAALEAE